MEAIKPRRITVDDPPIARFLFGSTAVAWIWLLARVWLGYVWLTSSLRKVGDPNWVQTGAALKGFWERAVMIPEQGRPPITFDWYRSFIQFLLDTGSYAWFGKVVAYGELLVGLALILGAFTGIAAVFGAFMNWNFLMAGTVSISPVMLPVTMLLILAWKVAGYYGLDRYLLPMLGTPWQKGQLFNGGRAGRAASPAG
jgi:thiosulfate dehydrogenase [quinone] large subunit